MRNAALGDEPRDRRGIYGEGEGKTLGATAELKGGTGATRREKSCVELRETSARKTTEERGGKRGGELRRCKRTINRFDMKFKGIYYSINDIEKARGY